MDVTKLPDGTPRKLRFGSLSMTDIAALPESEREAVFAAIDEQLPRDMRPRYSTTEAARMLGVKPSTVRGWLTNTRLVSAALEPDGYMEEKPYFFYATLYKRKRMMPDNKMGRWYPRKE